jgi:hypothetical protein
LDVSVATVLYDSNRTQKKMSLYNQNTHLVTNYTLERINVADFLGQLRNFVSDSLPLLQEAVVSSEHKELLNIYTGKVGIALALHRAQQKLSEQQIPFSELSVLHAEDARDYPGIGLAGDTVSVDLYNCLKNNQPFQIEESTYSSKEKEDEVLNGRAGLAFLLDFFVRKGVSITNPNLVQNVLSHIPMDQFPWEWEKKHYYGAAHGSAGILLGLKRFGDHSYPDLYHQLISAARLPSGNFKISQEDEKDYKVQWCHGATGFIPLLYEYHQEELKKESEEERNENMNIIHEALEVCWQRGISTKGAGICHGIAGNAYPFLVAFLHSPRENKKYLAQAVAFAHEILYSGPLHSCGQQEFPFSLFQGLAGVIHFLLDLMEIIPLAEKHDDEKLRQFILFDGLRIFN